MKWILTDSEIEAMKKAMKAEAKAEAIAEYNKTEEMEERRRVRQQKDLEEATSRFENKIAARGKCTAHFDFNDEHIKVFSVERMEMYTDNERTVVGYYMLKELDGSNPGETKVITSPIYAGSSGTSGSAAIVQNAQQKNVREWTLYCSREQHNELVAKFEQAKRNRREQEPSKKQLLQG
jgi:hypothetical protein